MGSFGGGSDAPLLLGVLIITWPCVLIVFFIIVAFLFTFRNQHSGLRRSYTPRLNIAGAALDPCPCRNEWPKILIATFWAGSAE